MPLIEGVGTYDQIEDPPKVLVTVLGANHYGIANEDNPFRDPMEPILPQEVATETIARWSALFLRAHIQGDGGAFDYVYRTGDDRDENVSVISTRVPEPSRTGGIFLLGMGLIVTGLRRSKDLRGLVVLMAEGETNCQKAKD